MIGAMLVTGLSITGYIVLSLLVNDPAPDFTSSAWVAVAQPTSEPTDDTVSIDVEINSIFPDSITYTITVCGPDPYNGVLLASGLADTSTSYFAANKSVGQSLPVRTLGASYSSPTDEVRAVAVNLPDILPCSAQNEATSAFIDVTAVLARPWSERNIYVGVLYGPRISWAFPTIGQVEANPLVGAHPFQYQGLSGSWILPPHRQYTAEAAIPSGWNIDSTSPLLADQTPPTWTADTVIAPTAQLSKPGAIAQIQDIIVVLAVVFGISGGLLASLIFEYLRPQREQSEHQKNYSPPQIEMAPTAQPPPESAKNTSVKTILTGLVAVLFVGYLRHRNDRRR